MERVIEAMSEEVAPKGSLIIREGDNGDKFYVVEQGAVEFLKGTSVVGTVSAPVPTVQPERDRT